MRHQKTRHKLSRDAAHRKALLANLCKEVIEHERIKTTEAKAKAVKPEIEKLITLARRGDLHARRQALSALGQDKFAVHKLFEEVAPRYAERPGGYTRILKLGPRRSDATEMVFLELVCADLPAALRVLERSAFACFGAYACSAWPCHGGSTRLP
jgi:large subunit ribosomal protein L17